MEKTSKQRPSFQIKEFLTWDSLREALCWLFFTCIGAIPIWASYIILRLFSQTPSMETFAKNGEFAIFGAGILSSILFEVNKEKAPKIFRRSEPQQEKVNGLRITFPGHDLISFGSYALILVALLVFSGITISDNLGQQFLLNNNLIKLLSIITVTISIVLGFIVTIISNFYNSQLSQQKYELISCEGYNELEKEFDESIDE